LLSGADVECHVRCWCVMVYHMNITHTCRRCEISQG